MTTRRQFVAGAVAVGSTVGSAGLAFAGNENADITMKEQRPQAAIDSDKLASDQNSLNLLLRIKDGKKHYSTLLAIVAPRSPSLMRIGLDKLRTVHFARFFFVDKKYLCLVTSYDGEFEDYLSDFVEEIGQIFDNILEHVADAPPLPVKKHRREFAEFVRKNHQPNASGPVYSAYPNLSTVRILTIAGDEARATKST